MTSQPLVSIITPSFNQAAYLEAAMRSVLAQDYPHIEYLVVDGASTDGSPEVIQRYAHLLAWWVSAPDRGQADAINKGFRRAKGEIVAWLNSDDLYLPGAVSGAVAAMQQHPQAGMLYSDAVSIDPGGRPLNRLAFGDWGLGDFMRFRIICQPAVFMRRTVLEASGFLDASYHFMLDHKLWLQMARLAPAQHIPALWAAARHHPLAKNVVQAVAFGEETFRLFAWLREQPDFSQLVRQDASRIAAGAYRLNARYLLDGGMNHAALKSYGCALWYNPPFALMHWRRMLFALFCLAGASRFARWAAQQRRFRAPDLSIIPGIHTWYGLTLETPGE